MSLFRRIHSNPYRMVPWNIPVVQTGGNLSAIEDYPIAYPMDPVDEVWDKYIPKGNGVVIDPLEAKALSAVINGDHKPKLPPVRIIATPIAKIPIAKIVVESLRTKAMRVLGECVGGMRHKDMLNHVCAMFPQAKRGTLSGYVDEVRKANKIRFARTMMPDW